MAKSTTSSMMTRTTPSTTRGFPIANGTEVAAAVRLLLRADRSMIASAGLLTLLAALLSMVPPYVVGRLVDAVQSRHYSHVDSYLVIIVVCAATHFVVSRYGHMLLFRFGETALASLREQFVDQTLALPSWSVERAGTGDLVTRSSTDIDTVGEAFRFALAEIGSAVLQIGVVLGATWWLNPWLGICATSGLPISYFASSWYLRRSRSTYLAEGESTSVAAETLVTTAEGAHTIETFGLQQERRDEGHRALVDYYWARRRTLRLRSVYLSILEIGYFFPIFVMLAVGGLLYLQGGLSLGLVVTGALYTNQLVQPVEAIMLWVEQLQRAAAAMSRIRGVYSVEDTTVTTTERIPSDDHIAAVGVEFTYPGSSKKALAGIDLDIRPGERLAVVGPSGAGKSTLSKVLAGIEEPDAGAITVGGVPVSALTPKDLRSRIVLVTQELHVFLGSLRENVALARADATDEDIRAALGEVGALWATSIDLDTQVGAGRLELDPQQSQQIALARVILANPHTVILDEATSLLDPVTARNAEGALSAAMKGRTVIAIAHRLYSAYNADRIAVVDHGRIVESGSHDDLLALGGQYATLWASWHG